MERFQDTFVEEGGQWGKRRKYKQRGVEAKDKSQKKYHYWKIVQVKGTVINKIDNVMNGTMNE